MKRILGSVMALLVVVVLTVTAFASYWIGHDLTTSGETLITLSFDRPVRHIEVAPVSNDVWVRLVPMRANEDSIRVPAVDGKIWNLSQGVQGILIYRTAGATAVDTWWDQ